MIRRPPRSTRTDTLFPYTTLFRSTDDRIGALAVETTLHGWREVGIAQALRQALAVATGVRVEPRHGLPERGMSARLARALGQACLGSRGWLVHGQRQVVPLPVHRSEERRVGTGCDSTCRSRRSGYH